MLIDYKRILLGQLKNQTIKHHKMFGSPHNPRHDSIDMPYHSDTSPKQTLPIEIFAQILTFLDHDVNLLCKVALLNKHWKTYADNHKNWKEHLSNKYPSSQLIITKKHKHAMCQMNAYMHQKA